MKEHEVSVTELRKRFGRYIRMVEDGDVIKITKYRKVIAYIIPVQIYDQQKMADMAIESPGDGISLTDELLKERARDKEKEESKASDWS